MRVLILGVITIITMGCSVTVYDRTPYPVRYYQPVVVHHHHMVQQQPVAYRQVVVVNRIGARPHRARPHRLR